MNRIVIIGSGRFGRFARYLAETCQRQVAGFLDDTKPKGQLVDGLPVLGSIQTKEITTLGASNDLLICISHREKRKSLYREISTQELKLANLIHPTCIIYPEVSIGKGVIMQPYTTVQTGADIADNVLIEDQCSIGVDVAIGTNSIITPHVVLAGGSLIEDNCFIGSNSIVNPEVKVRNNCTIGSGSTVINDTLPENTYAGSPVKLIEKK